MQGTYGWRSNGLLMFICRHAQRTCSILSRSLLAARIEPALLTSVSAFVGVFCLVLGSRLLSDVRTLSAHVMDFTDN